MKRTKGPQKLVLTYRFRIKGASAIRRLKQLGIQVNLVWNYCNETSFHAIRDHGKWISQVKLDALLAGTSKLTGLHSQSVQAISKEYVTRRIQHKKRKLRWRISKGPKKSLGWIPFKASGIKINNNKARYAGQEFKFWDSWDGRKPNQRSWKEESVKVLCGSFSEDAKGNWYLNLTCEVKALSWNHPKPEAGADPGLKDTLVFSDGAKIKVEKNYRILEKKLAKAQRAGKKKQTRNILRKGAQKRKDHLHKSTTNSAQTYRVIYLGDLSAKFLQKTNGKSSADASVGKARQLLKYKAIRHSGFCKDVSERSSTITCSICLKKTGPNGLSDLGVREWTCSSCGSHHDRDINAARNILRFGRESLKQPERAV